MKRAVIGSTDLVGSPVVAHAESRGHAVTGISKASGVDPLIGAGVQDALAEVEAIVTASRVRTSSGS
jgi:putative NADH-flavin reductase